VLSVKVQLNDPGVENFVDSLSNIFKNPKAGSGQIDKRIGSQQGIIQGTKMKNNIVKNRFNRGSLFALPDGSTRAQRLDGGER